MPPHESEAKSERCDDNKKQPQQCSLQIQVSSLISVRTYSTAMHWRQKTDTTVVPKESDFICGVGGSSGGVQITTITTIKSFH